MSDTIQEATTLGYGLTPGGFVRMRFPEIRRVTFDALNIATGRQWDETPNSLIGQLVNVFSEREAAVWELLERVYLAAYPVTASGQSLDLAVSYAGVRRLQETRSRVQLTLYGEQGVVVPQGSEIESTDLPAGFVRNPRFRLVAGVAISRETLSALELIIPANATTGRNYSISLNGLNHTTAIGSTETPAIVAARFASMLTTSGFNATASGSTIIIVSGASFTASWSDTVSLVRMGSPGLAEAVDGGPVPAPAASLTRIITPIGGWDAVTNVFPATLGIARETDAQLRARYQTGVFKLGAGVLQAIDANVRNNVPGLLYAKVYENIEDVADADGRPPHSVELIAEGGDSNAIGVQLLRVKGAGIKSHGNVSVQIKDIDGFTHTVRFTRPTPMYMFLRVQVVPDPEETIPGDADERVRAAIVAAGSTITVGKDVRLQRIASAALSAVPGVARLNITAAFRTATGVSPALGEYNGADVVISTRQRAMFAPERVEVYR